MPLSLKAGGHLDAFAIIVDINSFTSMVSSSDGQSIAQFTRDILAGAIHAIEQQGGEVVGYMGDAILGLVDDAERTFLACVSIAKDLDQQCSYISSAQRDGLGDWQFSPGGPSLKIGVEFGALDVSTISSSCFGERLLVIGNAINYAARITKPGVGNRCHIGPQAAARGFDDYRLEGPLKAKGKKGERSYDYFKLDMSETWIEGPRKKGADTYWD